MDFRLLSLDFRLFVCIPCSLLFIKSPFCVRDCSGILCERDSGAGTGCGERDSGAGTGNGIRDSGAGTGDGERDSGAGTGDGDGIRGWDKRAKIERKARRLAGTPKTINSLQLTVYNVQFINCLKSYLLKSPYFITKIALTLQ